MGTPLRQQVPLQADGTTLGADNGIGVATALASAGPAGNSAEYPLPPLECLFTVDEETGLTGAFDLDPSLLTGTSLHLIEALHRIYGVPSRSCACYGCSGLQTPQLVLVNPELPMLSCHCPAQRLRELSMMNRSAAQALLDTWNPIKERH